MTGTESPWPSHSSPRSSCGCSAQLLPQRSSVKGCCAAHALRTLCSCAMLCTLCLLRVLRRVMVLEDNDLVHLRGGEYEVYNAGGRKRPAGLGEVGLGAGRGGAGRGGAGRGRRVRSPGAHFGDIFFIVEELPVQGRGTRPAAAAGLRGCGLRPSVTAHGAQSNGARRLRRIVLLHLAPSALPQPPPTCLHNCSRPLRRWAAGTSSRRRPSAARCSRLRWRSPRS